MPTSCETVTVEFTWHVRQDTNNRGPGYGNDAINEVPTQYKVPLGDCGWLEILGVSHAEKGEPEQAFVSCTSYSYQASEQEGRT